MEVYRLFHGTNDPLDGTGAAIYGARWNPVGHAVVYAAWTFEGALLEKLVHSNIGHPPPNVRAAEISIPDDIQVPILDVGTVTDWQRETNSQAIGKQWLKEAAAVALVVPSLVARPWGRNVLINPAHPDFARVTVVAVVDVVWDPRLVFAAT